MVPQKLTEAGSDVCILRSVIGKVLGHSELHFPVPRHIRFFHPHLPGRSSRDERRTASEDGVDQIEKLVRRRCPGLRLAHACDARIVVALDVAVRTGVHVRVDHPIVCAAPSCRPSS